MKYPALSAGLCALGLWARLREMADEAGHKDIAALLNKLVDIYKSIRARGWKL